MRMEVVKVQPAVSDPQQEAESSVREESTTSSSPGLKRNGSSSKKNGRHRPDPEQDHPGGKSGHHNRATSISLLNLEGVEGDGFENLASAQDVRNFHQQVNQILWPQQSPPETGLTTDTSFQDHSYADLVLDTEAPLDSGRRSLDYNPSTPDPNVFKFSRRMKLTESELNFGQLVDVCPRVRSKKTPGSSEQPELPVENARRYLLGPDCSLQLT